MTQKKQEEMKMYDEGARMRPDEKAAMRSHAGPPKGSPLDAEKAQQRKQDAGPNIEVVPQNELWRIRGAGEDDGIYDRRSEAVARARSLATDHETVLTIFDEDGEIEEQQDYGAMGYHPGPEEDVTGSPGVDATARAEERSMHRD